jgi:hypothetical protein
MKKLLLILLCLPMIGFGQEQDARFYLPINDKIVTSNGGMHLIAPNRAFLYYDGFFTGLMGASAYDSLYGVTDFFGNLENVTGHNYHNNLFPYQTTIESAPLFDLTVDLTYLSSNPDLVQTVISSGSTIFGAAYAKDSLAYDVSDNLIKWCNEEMDIMSSVIVSKTTEYLYNASNQYSEIRHFDSQNILLQTDYVSYDLSGKISNVVIDTDYQLNYLYNSNGVYAITYFLNNVFVDTVVSYIFNNNGLVKESIIKDYHWDNHDPDIKKEIWDYNTNNDGTRLQRFGYDSGSWILENDYNYVYNGATQILEEFPANKELLRITDLLGRETKGTNQLLFYIYDDGRVEKRIVIE